MLRFSHIHGGPRAAGLALALALMAGCSDQIVGLDPDQLAGPSPHLLVPPGSPPDIPKPACEIKAKCRGAYYVISRMHTAALADKVRGLQAYVLLISKRHAKLAS